jgi:ribose-phosphate pyrophosphokinase
MIKLNGIPINVTIFPDNTSQVWKVEGIKDYNTVEWTFESEAEFLHLAQLKDLLDAELCQEVTLKVSYLPYARQDKPVSNTTSFALTTFTKLLNTLNFTQVFFDDVHSYKAVRLINRGYNCKPIGITSVALKLEANLCYPDKGAAQRYHTGLTPVVLEKERDQLTGALTMKPLSQSLSGPYLVVDDICDGGGTFILAAKELYKAGASDVHLYVSHGIFSKGIQILRDAGIKRIFTLKGEIGE